MIFSNSGVRSNTTQHAVCFATFAAVLLLLISHAVLHSRAAKILQRLDKIESQLVRAK